MAKMLDVRNVGCRDRKCDIHYYKADDCEVYDISLCDICSLSECQHHITTDALDFCFHVNCTLFTDPEQSAIYGITSSYSKKFYSKFFSIFQIYHSLHFLFSYYMYWSLNCFSHNML